MAYWLASVGAGIYLAGTRSFLRRRRHGLPPLVRVVVLIATIGLRSLRGVLEPHAFVWCLAACAAATSRTRPPRTRACGR